MGTNYFCHIIPSKERKKELHDAIEANDFSLITKLTDEMYNPIRVEYGEKYIIGGVVHLGKRSSGWKFLWNPNIFVIRNGHLEDNNGTRRYVPDPNTPLYTYSLTKKGLKSFIDREDVLIYDEYDDKQDKEEFWNMALKWGEFEGWDAGTYEVEHPSSFPYCHSSDLVEVLKREGYKFTSPSCSDFYSDGLRFSTSTDFS